ncbi:MAG: RNA polymerase factor sigma-54 [Alphaproteobacteria bacterium]
MALSQRLELRQGQSLVMTPQLQQAIKLLQLSNLELAEFVEAELERNPLLEQDESKTKDAAAETPIERAMERDDYDPSEEQSPPKRESEPAAPLADWSRTGGARHGDLDAVEGTIAAQATLRGHLENQLAIAALPPDHKLIAAVLVESIDESGYLRIDLNEVAARLGAAREEIESVLCVLQGFDPPGVFARDIAECLSLQLKERDRFDPAMQTMLSRLDLVAKRDVNALAVLCSLPADEIGDMIAEIRALTPKPGLSFGAEPVQAVVPDVYVRESADGGWNVELNTDTLPRVLVNARYYAKVSATARSNEERAYIAECFNKASWLIKSLDQRARTILKVASEIVRQQDMFLAQGVRHLRPLNLRAIADAIGMHESTVSRVTSNKYMATPRGMFEMKYFFTASIPASHGGEAHSAEAVRDRIRELIEKEDANTLSDDHIVELLRRDGVNIARRTVAKYREAMKLPSSVERRRIRQLEGNRPGR